MRILGIDPGLATGMAIFDTETLSFTHMEETPEGVLGFKPRFREVYCRVFNDPYKVTHMSSENFTLRSSNKFTADLSGVEIIGWLKGESLWGMHNPEPSQHMTLTRLRQKKDNYSNSVVTQLMKRDGYRIGKGHTRMAGSVAMWFAAMVLKDRATLALLKPKEEK